MITNGNAYIYFPSEIKVPGLYETEKTPAEDKVIYIKLFTPDANWTWYIAEYSPQQKRAFAYCHDASFPDGAEWGDIYINEIEQVRGKNGLRVERDLSFKPKRFSEIKELSGEDEETITTKLLRSLQNHRNATLPKNTPVPSDEKFTKAMYQAATKPTIIYNSAYYVRVDRNSVFCPHLVLDAKNQTVVLMHTIGHEQGVNAVWAAMMTKGATHYIEGNYIALDGMKQHIKLVTSHEEGELKEMVLLHHQASQEKANPGAGYTYILQRPDDKNQIPSTFAPMIDKTLGLPILPEWTAYLWQEGTALKLIEPLSKKECINMYAWRIMAETARWQEAITNGLQFRHITFPQ